MEAFKDSHFDEHVNFYPKTLQNDFTIKLSYLSLIHKIFILLYPLYRGKEEGKRKHYKNVWNIGISALRYAPFSKVRKGKTIW